LRLQKIKYLVCIAFLSIFFFSCSNSNPYIETLSANAAFNKGSYDKALALYASVLEKGVEIQAAQYNLACNFMALGETQSAIETYTLSVKKGSNDITAKAYFNLGVIYYKAGDFSLSYASFKEALKRNSSDLDAKINLELAYEKIKDSATQSQTARSQVNVKDTSINGDAIFNILRARERERFTQGSDQSSKEGSENDH